MTYLSTFSGLVSEDVVDENSFALSFTFDGLCCGCARDGENINGIVIAVKKSVFMCGYLPLLTSQPTRPISRFLLEISLGV